MLVELHWSVNYQGYHQPKSSCRRKSTDSHQVGSPRHDGSRKQQHKARATCARQCLGPIASGRGSKLNDNPVQITKQTLLSQMYVHHNRQQT